MRAALIGPSGQTILGPAGLSIGRTQSNQYVVYDRRVSAHHAVISFFKQSYFTITDRGSTNGTFVNGLLLTHNVPHILHAGDTICIGDTVLTFQISDRFHILPNDIPPFSENSPAWESPATDRLTRVRYRPDIHYQPQESQEIQASLVPNYTENNTVWQAATDTPSQKVDGIPTLARVRESHRNVVNAPTRSHHKILISILLVVLLLGVIAFNSFEYINRSTPNKTLDIFCKAWLRKVDC